MLRAMLLPILALVVAAATPPLEYDWAMVGNDDSHVLKLVATDASEVIVCTEFGFRVRQWDRSWLPCEEPGVPNREVHAAAGFYGLDYLTGRLNEEGHGYLELDRPGEFGTVVHGSTCGAFVDIVGYDSIANPAPIWACSRAGDTPGELVVSMDHGHTWTVVTGHGQNDFYDLYMSCADPSVLVVVGNAGIAATSDGGATWFDFSAGLGNVAVRRVQEDGLWTDLPDRSFERSGRLWACTDAGLFYGIYDANAGTCVWEAAPRIDAPIASVGFFRYGALAVTDDARVLLEFGLWRWADITGELAGFDLLPVGAGLLVATADDGIWELIDLPVAVDDLPAQQRCTLKASPNPFNPITVMHFVAPVACHARLRIYDLAGRLVATPLDADVPAGPGAVAWRPADLGAGCYVAKLTVGESAADRKLVLVK